MATQRRPTAAGPRRAGLLLPILLGSFALGGCTSFWEEMTRKDIDFGARCKNLFNKPNPMLVLRDSHDGDERTKALRALREPAQHGGTRDEQEVVYTILEKAAVSEHSATARMAAVESLSHFKDPRAAAALKAAYYQAYGYRTDAGEEFKYPPETVNVLRCKCLTGMGELHNPAVVEHLVAILREPPTKGSDQERQWAMDLRVAAARSLGKYNQPQATEALLEVLKSEKDVALRDRAHESLEAATGKKLPPDYQSWDAALHGGPTPENSGLAKTLTPRINLAGFFLRKDAGPEIQPAGGVGK